MVSIYLSIYLSISYLSMLPQACTKVQLPGPQLEPYPAEAKTPTHAQRNAQRMSSLLASDKEGVS